MFKGHLLAGFILLFHLVAVVSAHEHGAATVSTEHARVTLISEPSKAEPGQRLWLGLHFELAPHWHVYWRNPGDSGSAPIIRWTLPDGWHAGDIQWPVPKRIRVGPLTNYGYEDSVTFLVPVQVPQDPLPAGPLTIIADADWLICRELCIPETGRLGLVINDPGSATHAGVDTHLLFAKTRAQWPQAAALTGRYILNGDSIAISVDARLLPEDPVDIWFAANLWGPVAASRTQRWWRTPESIALSVPAGDVPPTGNTPLEGLLVVEGNAKGAAARRGYPVQLAAAPVATDLQSPELGTALVFALLGGLLLNIMPCVLPVLGIKILGFVKEAGANRRRLAFHGLMYGAGILISFTLLATALLALRAGGASLGWGFQLQSPVFMSLLAYLMLLVGLNLSGVFSVGTGLMGAGQTLTSSSGFLGTFATGVLAAVVASPCTAPFMGAALGFAMTRPAWEAFGVFLALGAGFALPVLSLSLFPAWLRYIPRPGPWTKHFQQTMAFPMYATAAWLLWVLSQQTNAHAYGTALAGLLFVAIAAWLYGQWYPRGWRLWLLGSGLTAALVLALQPLSAPDSPADRLAGQADPPWSEQQVRRLTAMGRPVFVNFTAAWCITCKFNEQVALSTENTRRLFDARSVAYLVADWTRRDPEITRQLERYGRAGVPLYLVYPPTGDRPLVLPQLLTEGIIANAILNL